MRLRDTVQSKWFKVEDLPGHEQGALGVTIKRFGMSTFPDGREQIDLYFHETPKPLSCNTTNRKRLIAMFGDDVELDDLIGRRIELYAELTQDTKGVPCWGVRIRPPMATVQAASADARAKIEAARLRAGASAPPPGPRRMPQDAPADHPRPMSHRPIAVAPAPTGPVEPAGFVDEQDPGFDPFADDQSAGGRW